MSRSRHTDADVRFMQHMIVHHGQAVEMNALIEGRTQTPSVRLLGARIASTQDSEISLMRRWLRERGEAEHDPALADGTGHAGMHHGGMHNSAMDHGATDHSHMDHSGMDPSGMDHASMDHDGIDAGDVAVMPGMLTPDQMDALASSQGRRFDQLFLEGMILHHQGAIDMVDALLGQAGAGEDPQLSEFLSHVVADQSAEILRMQTLLEGYDQAPSPQEEPTP